MIISVSAGYTAYELTIMFLHSGLHLDSRMRNT